MRDAGLKGLSALTYY